MAQVLMAPSTPEFLMTPEQGTSSAVSERLSHTAQSAALRLHGVRYQAKDVSRAVAFYTTHLGFTLEHQQLPAFATLALGDFKAADERAWCIGFASPALWATSRTGRVESRRPSSDRPSRTH
jgi:hypothetical protein